MKYRKILLAYNGSAEGKRALLECAELANFLGADGRRRRLLRRRGHAVRKHARRRPGERRREKPGSHQTFDSAIRMLPGA